MILKHLAAAKTTRHRPDQCVLHAQL